MSSLSSLTASQRAVPGPRQWPLVGNPSALRGLLPFLEKQRHTYGDIFRTRILSFGAVTLCHPEHMQHVLVAQRHKYIKGATYDSTRTLLGNGLLTLDGEAWKKRRALAQPAFHRQSLERLTAVMVEHGARFFDKLARTVGPEGRVVDAQRAIVELTLDVVIAALFGEATLASDDISYEALGDALVLLSRNANGIRLPAWVPTAHNRKLQKTNRELERNVYQIIRAGRERPDGSGSLLSMLIDARDETGAALPDQALRDEVITMFIAGHETSAVTLTWLLTFLDGRLQVLSRMREEVEQVLSGREPTFHDVPKLAYVRQVIDETLRLRPAAPMVGRDLAEDDELAGYMLRAGESVVPYIWGVHRHREYWPDPERFDPERFAPGLAKGRHPWCYLPFSAGPRACIGNMFALTEMVVLVAQLLARFDVQVHSCSHIEPVAIATTRPSAPVHVRLTPRR